MPVAERRSRRSTHRYEALAIMLEACKVEGRYDVVVVSDGSGLLVGSSSVDASEAEEVAALLPRPDRVRDRNLAVRAVRIGDETLLVGAVGGRATTEGLRHAAEATRRILAA